VKVEVAADAAARAGLREGDIILSIANTEVTSVKDFDAVLSKQDKNKPFNVLFRRGEWAQFVMIHPAR
jgi:serine protease Do